MDNFRRGTSDGDRPVSGSDWTTLPGNFKRNGYFVAGTGKTFHPGDPYQFDYPYSWSFEEFPYGFGGAATKGHPDWKNTTSDRIWCDGKTVVCAGGEVGCPDTIKIEGGAFWCSIDTTKLPVMPDGSKQLLWDQAEVVLAKERLQHAAMLQRQARSAAKPNRPFFVAVGFHRPRKFLHRPPLMCVLFMLIRFTNSNRVWVCPMSRGVLIDLPWFAPKEFYDLYPAAETLPGPTYPNVPIGMPGVAWHGTGGTTIDRPLPTNETLLARRGLYATMSYVDSLVGDVLGELDSLGLANDTIVSFVGDHGQHVGEHNLWEKVWRTPLRVFFMFSFTEQIDLMAVSVCFVVGLLGKDDKL